MLKAFRYFSWALLGFSLAILALILVQRGRPASEEFAGAQPTFVAPFSLVDQSSKTVTAADFKGKVWVASFIFTRCGGPCPMITQKMKQLADEFPSPDLRFVSFTVDPEYDRPAVLTAYAKRIEADPRWTFLTGDKTVVEDLIRRNFTLTLSPDGVKNGVPQIAHSTRLALINRDGEIEGTFDAFDVDGMRGLRDELRRLKA